MPDDLNQGLPTGLHWKGKKTEVERIALPFQTIETINESRATREKEKGSMFKNKSDTNWYDRLIWGDNKYIMSSLLDEFAGKIDLIYIDPPFATGADFSVKIEVGDVEWTKEPSAIEEKAYRDTWGKGLDSYLQMLYERLVLMHDLLSEKGSIYVHLDWHVGHYVKIIMDEIFGKENFRNEIVWQRTRAQHTDSKSFGNVHDTIYCYSKSSNYVYNIQYVEHKPEYLKRFNRINEKGRRYMLIPAHAAGPGSARIFFGKVINPPKGRHWAYTQENIDKLIAENKIELTSTGMPNIRQYLEESKGAVIQTLWTDVIPLNPVASERLNFPTQKPEALLERIIKASSNEGALVADFFCGSGTTGAVAEKLGRRWIMADLSRYAIHTTRKRLLGIEGCKPFVVQNLGKYERQYWQDITFKKLKNEQIPIYEYIKFILKLYNAEPITGLLHIHGKKGKHLVHVGAVDSPVTFSEINEAIDEVKKSGQNSLDILGWEWEMGLHDVIEKEAKAKGVTLRLYIIPRDVMDRRAVEKGDITFYELAYLEVEASKNKYGEYVVELKDFAIPNLDLIPEDVRSKIKKWSDYIDYWAVDWDWNEDTFHNMWQSYRTRKERKLELKSDGHKYEEKDKHFIMVKVIDIFGNDTTRVLEVAA